MEDLEKKTDADLEDLFSQSTLESANPKLEKLHSYFPKIELELKKVGVTVQHLWEEYFTENPHGLKSSQFRYHFRNWSNRVNPVIHMNHNAGDKMYVDYAGKALSIFD